MIIQAMNLILISFSVYLSAMFLRDLFGNFGFSNKVAKFVIPLIFSLVFFIIGAIYGINYALFALLPLILFSEESGLLIISALFVSYLHPAAAFLLLPPIIYSFAKAKENYSFINLPTLSYLIIPVAIAAIAISTYFLFSLPIAPSALFFVPITAITINLFEKKLNFSHVVLVSLALTLPVLSLLSNQVYNQTLISIGIIFSLVPILRRPFWVRG